MRPNSIATSNAIGASSSGLVDVVVETKIRSVVAGKVDVIEIVFCEFDKSAADVARSVIYHHHEATHCLSENKEEDFNDESSEKKLSLHSFRRQIFHVFLVAKFMFTVPSFNHSFYCCCCVVEWLCTCIVANILSDVFKDSRVSAAIVLTCTGTRVKTCNVGEILVVSASRHSR